MRIQIRLFNLMRIRIFLIDADPDPTFYPDADPDPDPSFKKRLKLLKKCQNRLMFYTFWLDICKLMRIRFRIQLINFDADPDPDFYLMRTRIRMRLQVTKMMRILADPDPQHSF